MPVCPFATYAPAGTPGGTIEPRLVILHSEATVGDARPHSGLEWHFMVFFDGRIEQLVPTERRADANYKANYFAISIETEDDGDPNNQPWTDEQLKALVKLVLWCCEVHGIPRRVADDWDGSGVGYHTMWGSPSPWTPYKKSCPGRVRIEQFDSIVLPAVMNGGELPPPPPPPPPAPPPAPAGPRLLRSGSEGADVREWQGQLNRTGAKLKEDGIFGKYTLKATLVFQKARGLVVDGIVGPKTRAAMAAALAPPPPPPPPPPAPSFPAWPGRLVTQPPVMRGGDVATWQQRMAERGWRITVDGAYGPKSEDVCRKFQAEKGLQVDGIVGPNTWQAAWTAPVT